jgi:branched-chain amino acid transport system substrate-binding protein
MNYLEAVQAAGTDNSDAVIKALDGKKINDVFLRNAVIRSDHRVVHDVYLAKVKTAAQVTEPWDYEKIVATIPAAQAFEPVSAACKM